MCISVAFKLVQTGLFIFIQSRMLSETTFLPPFCLLSDVRSLLWGPCSWMGARLPPPLSSSCCFWECAHDSWNIQWPHCWLSCAPYRPPPSPKSEDEDDDGDGAENGRGGDKVRDAALKNRSCCYMQRRSETSCPLGRRCMCTHQWPDVPIALGLQRLICTATAPALLYCWSECGEKEEEKMNENGGTRGGGGEMPREAAWGL